MKKPRITQVYFIILYWFCSILGIAPFYHFKKSKLFKQNLNKLWLVFLLVYKLFLITGYFRWKYPEFQLEYNVTTMRLLEHPSHMCYWMMPFTSALILLVYTSKNWEQFLVKFMHIKRILPLPTCKSRFIRPLLNFMLHVVILIYMYSFADYFQNHDNILHKIWNILYSSLEEITWLYMNIFVSETVLMVKDRYQALNQKFLEVIKRSIENKFVSNDIAYITVKQVKKIRFVYREITDLVDRINGLLGWHVFCLYTYTLIDTLSIVNNLIVGGDVQSIGTDSMELFVIIIYNIYITMSCDFAVQEGRKIIKICYIMEDNFPSKSPIREEIMEFADEVKYITPKFVSVGLFSIDRSMLLKMVTTVTTYIIIVTQFNNCQ